MIEKPSDGLKAIKYSLTEGFATISLNRPAQRNALDFAMREELGQVESAVRRDREIKVLVIGGAGGAFCSGGDISTMYSGEAPRLPVFPSRRDLGERGELHDWGYDCGQCPGCELRA